MLSFGLLVLSAFFNWAVSSGDGEEKVIYSSFIYNYNGDRTPLILPTQSTLTPLGAQQLEAAGSFFRQRYLEEANTIIDGIQQDNLDTDQVFVMSLPNQFVVASAQAFMQGLYPPVSNATSVLSNGTVSHAPLGGYQYPQIMTFGPFDPNSVFVAGHANCPAQLQAIINYEASSEALQIKSSTQDFYTKLQPDILDGVFENPDYGSAYLIFDYLNYVHTHNKTASERLSDIDLAIARGLADQKIHAIDGNVSVGTSSVGNSIQTIAGQTLAAEIVGSLIANFHSGGATGKLNLVFGSFQPLVAFTALAQLPKMNASFNGIPDYGSSMVIEMYSDQSSSSGGYPDLDDLYVRFLFRNGTEPSSLLLPYPLFGGDSAQVLSLNDFIMNMTTFATPSIGDWCLACESDSDFCAAYLINSSNGSEGSSPCSPLAKQPMKPAVAGVIGAVIALAAISIITAIFMISGGVRFRRTEVKRRSELGGFKAGEKLPSDQDLPRGQGLAGASVIEGGDDRVKSWELRERNMVKDRRPSYEGEEEDIGFHNSIQPTKIDERV